MAAAFAGLVGLGAFASPAEAQIMFDTAAWTPGTNNPSSTATAISAFNAAAGTAVTGYGCLSAPAVNGLNNQTATGGPSSDIAYHVMAEFVVGPTQTGTWQFRWGADFGRGGTLLVDGVELQSRWTDMWWGGSFTDPNQYLAGMVNLTAGMHTVEVYGFEDCCDGPTDAQFLSPDNMTWRDISSTNLTLVSLACTGASLMLTDSASPNPVNAGAAVTYTLFYKNTGTGATTTATLTQTLPAGVTFVSASGGGSYDAGTRTVTWVVGPVHAGASGSVTVTATIDAGVADQTTVTDAAQIAADNLAAPVTASAGVVVDNAAPTLTVGMTPDPVNAGDQLTVGLTYGNSGSAAATNAVLSDVIPANTTFVSAAAGGIYDAMTRTVSWMLGSIPGPGSATVSYVVSVASPVANHTPLTDMASLASDTAATVTNHATAYTASAPTLTFTDVPNPAPVAAGAPLSYTLSWANIGTDAAQNSVIQWALPAHVTFQTASDGGTYDSATNKVIWNVGAIAAGSSGGVTVTVLVDSPLANGTQITDQASLLTSNGGMPMANVTVKVTSAPALALAETGAPNPVAAGGQLVYTLTYANGGTDSAQNAAIAAAVPANTSFVSATGGGVYDSGANSVTFALGSLSASANPLGSVTFTVQVASPLANGTTLSASAMLSADNATGAPAMASDTVQSAPTLSLTNTGMPSPIDPGSLLTYTIAYANHGTDAAHGVTISDTLPSGLTIMTASNGGAYDSGSRTVTWSLPDLAAGASGSVTLTVLVDSTAPAGVLTDTATLSASNTSAPISADAMTAVNAVATTGGGGAGGGLAGASGSGMAGSSGTGAGGSVSSGAGGSVSSGAGGSVSSGAGGSVSSGAGGSVSSGAGGGVSSGTAGADGSGAGGSVSTGTAGADGTGAGGGASTGTAGADGTGAGGGASAGAGGGASTGAAGDMGTGADGGGAGGSSSSGAAGGDGTGRGGTGATGLAGSAGTGSGGSLATGTAGAAGQGAGGAVASGTGGSKAAGGAAGSGHPGAGGSTGSNASNSGCDCAVAAAPGSGSLLWLVPMAGVLAITRRRRRR